MIIIPKSCKRRVCRRCKAARAQTYYFAGLIKNQLQTILKDFKWFANNWQIIVLDGQTLDDMPDNTVKVEVGSVDCRIVRD